MSQSVFIESEKIAFHDALCLTEGEIVVDSKIFSNGVTGVLPQHRGSLVIVARRNTTLQDQVSSLVKEVSTLKEENISLRKEVSRQDEEINSLREEVSSRDEEISSLREEVSTLQQTVATRDEELTKTFSVLQVNATKESSMLRRQVTDLTERVEGLEKTLLAIDEKFQSASTSMMHSMHDIRGLVVSAIKNGEDNVQKTPKRSTNRTLRSNSTESLVTAITRAK